MIGPQVIYLAILIIVFAAIVWRYPSKQRKKAILSLGAWFVIIFAIIAIYSFRYDLLNSSIMANLIPGHGYVDNEHKMHFKKAANGHFYINTTINKTSIKFLVDTGASDISLSPRDARKLNIDMKDLRYTKRYNTANGVIKGAPIVIPEIKIGPFTLKNVSAVVNRAEMNESLLGMSLLSEFNVNISDDTLTIS